jgi:hypothetical protein
MPEAGAADLAYSTFLGGSSSDTSYAVQVDAAGDAYLAGRTLSANFPVKPNPGAFDVTYAETDAFVAKLRPGGAGANDLLWATFLGGTCVDSAYALAVDSSGNAYVAGNTCSTDFPVSAGAFDTTCGSGDECADFNDAFLAVLNPSGASLLYGSFFGGSDNDIANGIALSGNIAYLAGETSSANFPTTSSGYDRTCGADGNCNLESNVPYSDAFLLKVNRTVNGSAGLLYGSYIGGNDTDIANAVAVSGNQATVAGITYSPDFPGGGFGGETDAFATRIDTGIAGAGGLTYSRLIGGLSFDEATAVAVDSGGNAFLTGETRSTNFPSTAQGYVGGSSDAFIARLAGNGTVSYAACVGGTGRDVAHGLALGASGLLTLNGLTESTDFPVTAGAYDTTLGGSRDIFGVRLNLSLPSPVIYGAYLGGTAADEGFGVALDGAGRAYLTGFTPGGGYPTTTGAFDTTYNGSIRDGVLSVVAMQPAPPRAPQVTIAASGSAATLSWQPITLDVNDNPVTVTKYEVYRSLSPFFSPSGAPYAVVDAPATTFPDSGVLADVSQNYYYVVRALSAAGISSADSNRTGEFGYTLVKGS